MKRFGFRWKRPFLLVIILFIGVGCTFFPRRAASNAAAPGPSPTARTCLASTRDLSIQILFGKRTEDGQRATLNGIGFVPGERVSLRIAGQGKENTFAVEAGSYPVQADGILSFTDTLPLYESNMRWEALVTHQRGTACLRFTTP